MIKKIELIDFLEKNNLDKQTIEFIGNLILKNYDDKDLIAKEKIEAISKILNIKSNYKWNELIKDYLN